MKKNYASCDATRTETFCQGIGGARMSARARLMKVRESVAKSRKSVNEKNARLARRNAYAALADPANGRVQ
jgi:hypothetical protein